MKKTLRISPATPEQVSIIFDLIRQLAVYEKLEDMVVGNEAMLHQALFGPHPACECVLAWQDDLAVGFALTFTTFSTFLTRPGLYLEDLYVIPAARGHGIGKALLRHLAALALERNCGRFEWRVLDWNEPSIRFYQSLGAHIHKEWLLVRVSGDEIRQLAGVA
jgi:GNAT superfamily N-acetyltransferase